MSIEKQVTSLELSKRLKELGVKQESVFCWENFGLSDKSLRMRDEVRDTLWPRECFKNLSRIGAHIDSFSAFTVAELISLLQSVAEEDIIVAWSDEKVADHLAQQLCTKLQSQKVNVGSGLTQ